MLTNNANKSKSKFSRWSSYVFTLSTHFPHSLQQCLRVNTKFHTHFGIPACGPRSLRTLGYVAYFRRCVSISSVHVELDQTAHSPKWVTGADACASVSSCRVRVCVCYVDVIHMLRSAGRALTTK